LEALFGSQRNTAAAAATSTAATSSHLLSVTSGSQNTSDRSGSRDALLFGLEDGVGSGGYQSSNKNPLPASSNKIPQITSHATNTKANSFQSTSSSSSSSSSIDSLLFPKQPLSTKPSKPATGGGLFDDDEDDGQVREEYNHIYMSIF